MKRIKEIDEEMQQLKKQKPHDWIKKLFTLKKERNQITSQIGIKKK